MTLDFQQIKPKIYLRVVSMGHINHVFAEQVIWDVVVDFIPTQTNMKKEKVLAPAAKVTDTCLV